jgi:hypothetical protein
MPKRFETTGTGFAARVHHTDIGKVSGPLCLVLDGAMTVTDMSSLMGTAVIAKSK